MKTTLILAGALLFTYFLVDQIIDDIMNGNGPDPRGRSAWAGIAIAAWAAFYYFHTHP